MEKFITIVNHSLILALFSLTLAGCGYKADPYYLTEEQEKKLEKK
jgi:predicted small lipoprotein YifL